MGQPHLCLDVPNGNNRNGVALQLWDCSSTTENNKLFVLETALGGLQAQIGSGGAMLRRNSTSGEALTSSRPGSSKVVTAALRWQKHTEWCLHVERSKLRYFAKLQTHSCSPNGDKFIIPADGRPGPIRWAAHPHSCLGSPGGMWLHFYRCGLSPPSSRRFLVQQGDNGLIRWARHPHLCLVVPGGVNYSGVDLRLWTCSASSETRDNQHFALWQMGASTAIDALETTRNSDGAAKSAIRATSNASHAVYLQWSSHPDKCLSVQQTNTVGGNRLQLWSCSHKSDRFLIPYGNKTGLLRWAKYPELCLDVPSNHRLQFWNCKDAPQQNLLFLVLADEQQVIRWAHEPHLCLDVPNGNTRNGTAIQLWTCTSKKQENMRFVAVQHLDIGPSTKSAWAGTSAAGVGAANASTLTTGIGAANGTGRRQGTGETPREIRKSGSSWEQLLGFGGCATSTSGMEGKFFNTCGIHIAIVAVILAIIATFVAAAAFACILLRR